MCGIAGIASWVDEPQVALERARAMRDAVRHRGPDDAGCELVRSGNLSLALVHRRLSIIDLSPAGHQPMSNPSTGDWIVFNGEIYNFRELRSELEKLGHVFLTRTDTEVILRAYGQWAADAWKRLRGIFAFALWDAGGRKLHLVRDQLGVKPLYYFRDRGRLLFGSEVRALLASEFVPRRSSPECLASFLAYGSVQEPFTMVEGVRSVPPASSIVIGGDGDCHDGGVFWRPVGGERGSFSSRDAVLPAIRERLLDAVRSQMVADVPVGVFLSGGIDSVALAFLAQRSTGLTTKTFSLVFEEERYDERRFSRIAAEALATDHTEVVLSIGAILPALDAAVAAFDQPSMDGINTYFVAKYTREAGIKVALSGVGGDEIFGGYRGYAKSRRLNQAAWLRRSPRLARTVMSWLAARSGASGSGRVLASLLEDDDDPYYHSRRLFLDGDVARLSRRDPRNPASDWRRAAFHSIDTEAEELDDINRICLREMRTYMTSTLLRDTDQMTMAHALEVRVPLIDPQLVEFMFTLPGAWKIDRHQPKPLLTLPLVKDLPEACVQRRKGNFELPFSVWLRGSLRNQVEDTFLQRNAADELIDGRVVASLWSGFMAGQVSWSRIWSLYVLKHWLIEHRITL